MQQADSLQASYTNRVVARLPGPKAHPTSKFIPARVAGKQSLASSSWYKPHAVSRSSRHSAADAPSGGSHRVPSV
eukprot:361223-Chlamydomonas_euryale.AAC.2